MDGSLSCALYLASEPISVLCLAAPDGTLWMYSGADGLFVLLGADDECGYQPPALPTVLRPCRTASHSESTTCSKVTTAACWCYFRKQPAAAIPYSSGK